MWLLEKQKRLEIETKQEKEKQKLLEKEYNWIQRKGKVKVRYLQIFSDILQVFDFQPFSLSS